MSSYLKGLGSFILFLMLLLCGACQQESQPAIQDSRQDYALSFVELGTVPGSRINLSYSCDSDLLADQAFSIGIYDLASSVPIETVNMGKGDSYQKDLPAGTYRVKVENPANYSFAYLPGEEFEVLKGIVQIQAVVVNSKQSTQDSPPVTWELYYSKEGSPAGEKPLAQGEVPALKPGQFYTINYDLQEKPNPQPGNYMFRLFNPDSDSRTNECWSRAIYCPSPFKPTQVEVSLITEPEQTVISPKPATHASPRVTHHSAAAAAQGTLTISKIVEGHAPANASYEVRISGRERSLSQTLKSGQSITVKLDPGTYTVKELNSGEDYQLRQVPTGNITIKSNQDTYVSITSIYPVELPKVPE